MTGTYSKWADPIYRRAITPSSPVREPVNVDSDFPPGTVLPRRIRDVKSATWQDMHASSSYRYDPYLDERDPSAHRQSQSQSFAFNGPPHHAAYRCEMNSATSPMYQAQRTGLYHVEVPYPSESPYEEQDAAHCRDLQFANERRSHESCVQYALLPPSGFEAESNKFGHAQETFPPHYSKKYNGNFDPHKQQIAEPEGSGRGISQFRNPNRNVPFERSMVLTYSDTSIQSMHPDGFVPQQSSLHSASNGDVVSDRNPFRNHNGDMLGHNSGLSQFRKPNRNVPSERSTVLTNSDPNRELMHPDGHTPQQNFYSTSIRDVVSNRNPFRNGNGGRFGRSSGNDNFNETTAGANLSNGTFISTRSENFESHDFSEKREPGFNKLYFLKANNEFGGNFQFSMPAQQLPKGIDRFKNKRQVVDDIAKKSDSSGQKQQGGMASSSDCETNQDEGNLVPGISSDAPSSNCKRPTKGFGTRSDKSVERTESECTEKDKKRHRIDSNQYNEQEENVSPSNRGQHRLIGSTIAIQFFNGDMEVDLSGRPIKSAQRISPKQPVSSPDPLETMSWKNKESLWG